MNQQSFFVDNFDKFYGQKYSRDLNYAKDRKYEYLDDIIRVPVVGHNFIDVDLFEVKDPMELVPDPDNKYDPNAIRVAIARNYIGWIAREYTHLFHNMEYDSSDDWDILPKLVNGNEFVLYVVGA